MVPEKRPLDLIPNGVHPIFHASETDIDRPLVFEIQVDGEDYTPPSGSVITIRGDKPDGYSFSYATSDNDTPISRTGNLVTWVVDQQVYVKHGRVEAELIVTDGDGVKVGSQNFFIDVEKMPFNESNVSESDISEFRQLASSAAASAISAASSAATAAEEADRASMQNYLPLAGGDMNTGAQIVRDGKASSWYNGRDNALLVLDTVGTSTSYNPILSVKSPSGSWEIGTYYSDEGLHFVHITDSDYGNNNNTPAFNLTIRDGGLYFGGNQAINANGVAVKALADGNGDNIASTYLKKTDTAIRATGDANGDNIVNTYLKKTETAVRATGDGEGNNIVETYLTKTGTAAKATADANGRNIVNTYATKTEVSNGYVAKSNIINNLVQNTNGVNYGMTVAGFKCGSTMTVKFEVEHSTAAIPRDTEITIGRVKNEENFPPSSVFFPVFCSNGRNNEFFAVVTTNGYITIRSAEEMPVGATIGATITYPVKTT